MQTTLLTSKLKQKATELGFTLVGACPAVEPPGIHRFANWLAAGYAGEMRYLEHRRAAYDHPQHVMDGAVSILMLAMNYRTAEPAEAVSGQGRISRYAWGSDYHDLIRERINSLADYLRELAPAACARGVVDTAPLLEREFAQLAGLGWIGKNTLLLNRDVGSWFFLAALLTDLELTYDSPHENDHCGTCTACLDACPTDAFPQPYVLDSRKCISYLTIELKGPIPMELRSGVDNWLFGCDVCQEVCPWNHRAPQAAESSLAPLAELNPVDLARLFEWTEDEFRARFRHTPLWRPKRRGILRNAAIVLGNHPTQNSVAALTKGLCDSEVLVRGASAWALGRIGGAAAGAALRQRLELEQDSEVIREINSALSDEEKEDWL